MGSKRLSDPSWTSHAAKRPPGRPRNDQSGKLNVDSITHWATTLTNQQETLQAENASLKVERDDLAALITCLGEKAKVQGEELDSAYRGIMERDELLEEVPKLEKRIDVLVNEVIRMEDLASEARLQLESVEKARKKLADELNAAKADVVIYRSMAEDSKAQTYKYQLQCQTGGFGGEPKASFGEVQQPTGTPGPATGESDHDKRQLAITRKELHTARQHSANSDKRATFLAKDVNTLRAQLAAAEDRIKATNTVRRDASVEICSPNLKDATKQRLEQTIAHLKETETLKLKHEKEMRDCHLEEKRLQSKVDKGHARASEDQKRIGELEKHSLKVEQKLDWYKGEWTRLKGETKETSGSAVPRPIPIADCPAAVNTQSSGPAWPKNLESRIASVIASVPVPKTKSICDVSRLLQSLLDAAPVVMSYQNGFPAGPAFDGGYGASSGGGYGNGRGRGGAGRRDDNRRGGPRGRGGGGGGGYGSDRAPPPESSTARLRKMVVKIGEEEDFMPIDDPPRLAKVLRRGWKEGSQGVLEGFRIGVTEEPHKHPHFASLLLALSRRPSPVPPPPEDIADLQVGEKRKAPDGTGPDETECGVEILQDLNQAFRGWVESRQWLNVRLCLQFFSLLVSAGLVSAFSLLDVYKSLLSVLGEVGGGGDRAGRVIRAVGEGLIRSGSVLFELFPEDVETLVGSIETAILGRKGYRAIHNPLAPILPHGEEGEPYQDSLNHLLSALHGLRDTAYSPPDCLPCWWESAIVPEGLIQPEPYDLTAVSMPPEMYDVDEDSRESGEGRTSSIAFFADDVVPPPNTLTGWTLRSLVVDIIHIFEVNRKECAVVLIDLRRDFAPGTFKPLDPTDDASSSTLSLESLIISTLLSTMLTLPSAPEPLIYYGSVITELCKLSPNTIAPPVGRAVRKLFSLLGSDGLDVEVAQRAGEWFATHLSNFGFQWMWKEWIPELELPASHPRRAFMRRVVELEVRLAYHDRIMQTLPDALLAEGVAVISPEPPEPVWPYEKDDYPLHSEAVGLLKLFRQKASAMEVRSHLQTLADASFGSDGDSFSVVRQMASETLLHLGSRSFSHFLNATERYLDVLRYLTPDPPARRTLLDGVSSYWRQSSQMRLVTVDKYIQYGVLEGHDVIDWVFAEQSGGAGSGDGDGWTDGDKWEMLRMCLDKHVGKVAGVQRRVRMVEKEDEAARARRAADKLERGEGVGEDEDVELDEVQLERSKEARDAQTLLDINTTKLERILISTTEHFVMDLVPWCFDADSHGQGLKAVLTLLDSGEEGWWGVRARWGWWREFVRRYRVYLELLTENIEENILANILDPLPERDIGDEESVEARAEAMVLSAWSRL